MDYKYKMH